MNNISWDDFRYFLAAAEAGSFSAAAKQLHSNQPTVRRHIGTLENCLGVTLFRRRTQGLSLTEEGLSILEQCQKMQSSVIKISRTLGGKENNNRGTVRVSLPEGICSELFVPNLGQFYETYPNIKLILHVSSQTVNLTRGEADIAIRLFRPMESELVIKKLTDMTMSLYASGSYISAHGRLARMCDIKQHKFVGYGDGLYNLAENQWLIDRAGLDNILLRTDSTLCRIKATEEGVGVSMQPELLADKNNNLVKAFSDASIPHHQVWLAYHNDIRHLDRVRAVVDFIVQMFK